MEAQADRYYRDSGAVPFLGTILMLLGGIAASFVVSFVYALIAYYNPFIYVTFFATLGFGAAVGYVINRCAHWGAVRNKTFLTLIGIVVGLLSIYFAWTWYIFILSQWDARVIVIAALDPASIFSIVQHLAETGVWSIKNATPTGWALYSFWIIETALVVFTCTTIAVGEPTPYCEACRRWTTLGERSVRMKISDVNELRQNLENENYEAIDSLAAQEYDKNHYHHAEVHRCGGCDQSTYLSIAEVTVTLKEGEPEVKKAPLIKFIAIPDDLVPHLDSIAVVQEERDKKRAAEAIAKFTPPASTPAAGGEPANPATGTES